MYVTFIETVYNETYRALSQLLFSGEDHATATRAALAFGGLDGGGVGIVIRTVGGNLLLAVK